MLWITGMTVLQDIKEQLKEQGARLEVVENRLNKASAPICLTI